MLDQRESRPWFSQHRGYAEANNNNNNKDNKDQKDSEEKEKTTDEEGTESKTGQEDEAKPDAEEAAQAGQFGGAGASVFMGSLYYLVTRQQVESAKKDSNLVLMLDLANKRRTEEQVALMRLNRVETFRDMVTPVTDTSHHYFAFNPKVMS
ncbi:hypothetical protein HW132_35835, partial [Brasilonema sp. CT11]|nr:hypothetical protein [Brasilonema sp. CT11]